MTSPAVLSVLLLSMFQISLVEPRSTAGEPLKNIGNSMERILASLGTISTSIEKQALQTCNRTLEHLDNADTDWNPEAIYAHNEEVSVACKTGFRTKLKQTIQKVSCLLGNQWSKFQPCSEAICLKSPGIMDHADTDWNLDHVYGEGDNVTITCKPDYRTKDGTTEQTIVCLTGDNWSDFQPCQPVCPAPFKKQGNLCIFTDSIQRNWRSAKKSCSTIKKDYKSSLLMLQNADKQRDFSEFMNKHSSYIDKYQAHWIGGHDLFEDGAFVWNDSTDLSFHIGSDFEWGSSQPDNSGGHQDCLAVFGRGLLDDVKCSDERNAFCEIPL